MDVSGIHDYARDRQKQGLTNFAVGAAAYGAYQLLHNQQQQLNLQQQLLTQQRVTNLLMQGYSIEQIEALFAVEVNAHAQWRAQRAARTRSRWYLGILLILAYLGVSQTYRWISDGVTSDGYEITFVALGVLAIPLLIRRARRALRAPRPIASPPPQPEPAPRSGHAQWVDGFQSPHQHRGANVDPPRDDTRAPSSGDAGEQTGEPR